MIPCLIPNGSKTLTPKISSHQDSYREPLFDTPAITPPMESLWNFKLAPSAERNEGVSRRIVRNDLTTT